MALCGMRLRLSIVGTFTTTILIQLYSHFSSALNKMGRQNLYRPIFPLSTFYELQLREPTHYLRRCRGSIHHAALMNQDRCAFLGVGALQVGLTGDETGSIDSAACDEADAFAIRIDD